MKKLVIIILIVVLSIIGYSQYKKYKRANLPSNYTYQISDKIDKNYYNPRIIDEYFQKAKEAENFAVSQWRNEEIDVKSPAKDSEKATKASEKYNQLMGRLKEIETKLLTSSELKSKGFDNEKIKLIELGIPENLVGYFENGQNKMIGLKEGDEGERVWKLQGLLNKKGYKHKQDGVFKDETSSALRKFQTDYQIYPSGVLTADTFRKLIFK